MNRGPVVQRLKGEWRDDEEESEETTIGKRRSGIVVLSQDLRGEKGQI